MGKWTMHGLAVAILVAVAWVYFPIVHAGFVWDDWPSFRDLQGDRWSHYVFRDFNQWTIYFRPLVVAFLALQVKLFHGAPGPMHAVSLALHLVNIALVGALAHRVGALAGTTKVRQALATLAAMLIYGLHPALIETVSWIGCQFDLITTLVHIYSEQRFEPWYWPCCSSWPCAQRRQELFSRCWSFCLMQRCSPGMTNALSLP